MDRAEKLVDGSELLRYVNLAESSRPSSPLYYNKSKHQKLASFNYLLVIETLSFLEKNNIRLDCLIHETTLAMSIFLSYSHADRQFARLLYHDLKSRQITVWIDEGEMLGGDSLINKIEDAINNIDSVGVILSSNSVNSKWVQEEVKMALNREINGKRLKIIPILIENCEIPGFLFDRYRIDFRGKSTSRYEESLDFLVNTLYERKVDVPKIKRSEVMTEDPLAKPHTVEPLSDAIKDGNYHHDRKEYVEAIHCYEQVIANQNFLIALNNKATSLLDLEQYDEAFVYYDFVLKVEPDYVDAWVGKGLTFAMQGEMNESIKYYDKAIAIDQKSFGAWTNKGNSLSELESFEQAVECYDRALEIDNHNPAAWTNKGAALISNRRYMEGIECYNRAIEIDPNMRVPWNNKGLILRQLDRPDEALECYRRALEIEPDNINTLYNKAAAHYYLKQFDEADSCYDKILRLSPNYANAWGDKGAILSERGQYDQAIKLYNKAIGIEPTIARIWYNKGITLRLLGREEEAKECLNRANELSSSEK